MKKITLLFISLFLSFGTIFAQSATELYQTVVFDFVYNGWGIPNYSPSLSSVKQAKEYTYNNWTIKIDPTAQKGNFYYDNRDNINQRGFNCLRLANQGSKIVLPAFGFPVEKIVLSGHPEATDYPNVEMSVFVGENEVSNTSTGTAETYTYEIASDYQAAGNIYEMVIKSSGNSSVMFITSIKVYPATNRLEAPVFDKAAGVYTEPIDVIMSSPTANIEGVENVIYYYTTDGYEPDEECDETEDGEITISESCTLKAVVSLDYNGKSYISESSSAEYIMSKSVTATKAEEIGDGSYFIAANGNIATLFNKNDITSKEIAATEGDKITDAEYFAFTFESTNGNFNIKDGAGNYIQIDIRGILMSSKSPVSGSAWNVYTENGVAKISNNDFYLVYSEETKSFTITNATDENTIFPTLYRIVEENNDSETSIAPVATSNENVIYDITGRQIKEIRLSGIYIINGKKILVK